MVFLFFVVQAQASFGPPSLPVGTEVSAKYRGAFCEAKVKTVVRVVKCKVNFFCCASYSGLWNLMGCKLL